MCAEISNFAVGLLSWDNLTGFLNSNFTAALAGALAGALAAQRIADRAKQRDALLQEVRIINAAIMVTFTICNAGLALKKQFVKGIYEEYSKQKELLQEFHRRRNAGEQPRDLPFEFRADFRTVPMPVVPIDLLRTQVFEHISVTGRPLALVSTLAGAVASLAGIIQKRDTLIERFTALGPAGADQLPAFYFGLPYGPGHVSMEYVDTIEGLRSLTEDVIFFSELLGKDLMDHGNQILKQYQSIAKLKKREDFYF